MFSNQQKEFKRWLKEEKYLKRNLPKENDQRICSKDCIKTKMIEIWWKKYKNKKRNELLKSKKSTHQIKAEETMIRVFIRSQTSFITTSLSSKENEVSDFC